MGVGGGGGPGTCNAHPYIHFAHILALTATSNFRQNFCKVSEACEALRFLSFGMLFLLVRTIALRRVCYFWSGLLSVRKRNSCSRPTTMSLGSSVSSAVRREEEMVNNCMVVIVDINVGNRQRRIKAVEGQKAPLNIDDICMYSHIITYECTSEFPF